MSDRSCNETTLPQICVFTEPEGPVDTLFCDASACPSGKILLGEVDMDVGTVVKWSRVHQNKTLQSVVLEAVKKSLRNGFEFLFLKCRKILQALMFPPQIQRSNSGKSSNDERLNVNIVLLDSISRPHFYRVLPKSVRVLREIANDKKIPATALDFELYQCVGQNTFDNLRPMFSGVKSSKSS